MLMVSMFSPQIHIVFNCDENDRITIPLLNNPPNKIYYFTFFRHKTGQKDKYMSFYDENVELLSKKLPHLEIITTEVDYVEYISCIQEISKIIKNEREKNPNCNIFINASTGSKMTALASVEAAKLWDCKFYYVYGSDYNPSSEGPRQIGEMYIIEPVTFPIKKPELIYLEILKTIRKIIKEKYAKQKKDEIKEKFTDLKHLAKELEKLGIIELKKRHRESAFRYSALSQKCRRNLTVLEELECIRIIKGRKTIKIILSETGKKILEIFKFWY